ncbi:MAG: glycosyltransferase family 4 protein, partial [Candidatus Methylomirabilales bacterium]
MGAQMTLRVLFVSDVSPLAVRSGAERVLREQASRLAKLGHQVRVLSRSPEGGAREPVESEGVRIHHFPVDRRSLLRFVRDSILGARQAAAQALSDTDADVLQLHQPLSGVGVLSSPAATRIPSLYTFLSPAPLEYRSRRAINASLLARWAGTPGTALLWVIEGICLRRASRIHVLSEFSATQLQKLYRIPSERIVKIPGGVDTERFRPAEDRDRVRKALGLPTRTVLLFTLRNLEPRMGLDALIRAMATLRQYAPEARLLIGGTGSLRQELESLTASLGLRDQVSFLGFIPETELPLYYQAADAFVLPSRELEGFGLVTAEALACGTPVLGTRVGAIPEVLGGLGADLLFDRGDYEAIGRGIRNHLKRALADPEGYEALRRRCRDYAVSRFSWDQVARQLEQELLALAADHRGSGMRMARGGKEIDGDELAEKSFGGEKGPDHGATREALGLPDKSHPNIQEEEDDNDPSHVQLYPLGSFRPGPRDRRNLPPHSHSLRGDRGAGVSRVLDRAAALRGDPAAPRVRPTGEAVTGERVAMEEREIRIL